MPFDQTKTPLPLSVECVQGSLGLHGNELTGTVTDLLSRCRVLEPQDVRNQTRVTEEQELGNWPGIQSFQLTSLYHYGSLLSDNNILMINRNYLVTIITSPTYQVTISWKRGAK